MYALQRSANYDTDLQNGYDHRVVTSYEVF